MSQQQRDVKRYRLSTTRFQGKSSDSKWLAGTPALVGVMLLTFAQVCRGEEANAPTYAKDVAPLLTKYCAGCHNDDDREGDFSLESFASLRKGTPKGPAFLPGDAESSRIIRLITGDVEPRMPPEEEPSPNEEEVALLKRWIEAGAAGPAGSESSRPPLIVPKIASKADHQPVTAIATSEDGRWLAVARYATVALYDLSTANSLSGEPVRRLTEFPGKVASLHFSVDGKFLVAASGVAGLAGEASVWNVASGKLARRITAHRDLLYDAELSPDGSRLATCSYDRTIEIMTRNRGSDCSNLAATTAPSTTWRSALTVSSW